MALCSSCLRAVSTLHYYNLPQQKRISVQLPRYDSATRQDCWICCKFSAWLEQEYPEVHETWKTTSLDIVYYRDFFQYGGCKEWRELCLEAPIFEFGMRPILIHDDESREACRILCHFIPIAEYKKLASLNLQNKDRNELSTFDLPLLQNWTQRCTTSHDRCTHHDAKSWYPTRLLQLDKNGHTMKLIITQEHSLSGPYVTLSHRWSSSKYRKLTSTTSAEFQNSIDTSSLPPAFQEAGVLTSMLGVRYLWIDSLCIEQDSDLQDWRREAPKMRQVYGHSFLNLSATLSPETGTSSLFDTDTRHPFVPMLFRANGVKIRERRRDSRIRATKSTHTSRRRRVYKTGRFTASIIPRTYYLIDGEMWEHEVEDTPLQTRAWVYQERLLAPRVLHFGKRQLAWECKEETALQLFPGGLPSALVTDPVSDILSTALSSRASDVSHESFRDAWHHLVNRYSKCNLTKMEDKLIAFAGVAQLIEHARQDQYLGGLWKSTMVTDLAWTAYCGLRNDPDKTKSRAPSWSWLSLDTEIDFPEVSQPAGYFAEVRAYPEPTGAGCSAFLAEGSIAISGVVLPVGNIEYSEYGVKGFSVANLKFEDGWTHDTSHLDLVGPIGENQPQVQQSILMLPLYYTQKMIHGIAIVRSNGQANEYRRVGSAQIQVRRFDSIRNEAEVGWQAHTWRAPENGRPIIHHVNLAAMKLFMAIKERISRQAQEVITLV